jgi:hypothetical protein
MITPALAFLIALVGPTDTARVAPALPDSVVATLPSRLVLPVWLELEPDTVPRRRRQA